MKEWKLSWKQNKISQQGRSDSWTEAVSIVNRQSWDLIDQEYIQQAQGDKGGITYYH